jgi:hypothetical protein
LSAGCSVATAYSLSRHARTHGPHDPASPHGDEVSLGPLEQPAPRLLVAHPPHFTSVRETLHPATLPSGTLGVTLAGTVHDGRRVAVGFPDPLPDRTPATHTPLSQ